MNDGDLNTPTGTPKPPSDYVIVTDDAITTDAKWAIKSPHLRECLAEFFGTLVMITFGMGVTCQSVLSKETKGGYLSISIGWGIAVMLGVHCSDGISGAHMNPAVSVAQAVHGNFPWWKVPGYTVAQVFGAFVGSFLIFLLHKPNFDVVDPGRTTTRGIFATYPSDHISHLNAFYTETLGTAMLLIGIFALGDQRNRPASPFGGPVHIMLLISAIGMSFGMNTGYALNPARDLGPRIMTSIFGWGSEVWTHANYYFWIPLVAPFVGSIIGSFAYKLFISSHHPQNPVLPK